MGFHKIGCLRQGISNCQCPRNRVSQKLDVYFLGYIIEKVAETAEITKTAPKLSPKARKKPAKTRQKVAEITINPKTA